MFLYEKKSIPSYEKRTIADEIFRPRTSQTLGLEESILQIFPDARPGELKNWLDKKEKTKAPIEKESLLFMALICGTKFRMARIEPKKVFEYLWGWLTHGVGDYRMNPEMAELVIEALAPGIMKAIEERGYKRGPGGPYIKKRGRPPESRGAWVAAFVIEEYLCQKGMKSTHAKELAVDLIAILLGRKGHSKEKEKGIELSEFYRLHKKAPIDTIKKLTIELMEEYKFLLRQDGIRSKDLEPAQDEIENHADWALRHKSLQNYFKDFRYENVCSGVLTRIPHSLWEPFWDIK